MAGLTAGPDRPHVGRDREVADLVAAVGERDTRGAIVAGVAGVGKSHLLDRAAARLAVAGWAPLRARGDPTRATPFGAMAALLPQLAGEPERWALVLRRGLDHLVEQAAPARPLLVTDDLHAFDPASAALVLHAVLDGRVRLLGTLRVGDDVPDAVTSLWKDDLVERVDLGPLPRGEADALVERLVDGPVAAETRTRLWRWAEGSPLLVTELVTYTRDRGLWRQTAGLWRLDPRRRRLPVTSPSVAALLEERMADAPPEVVDLVDALAMAGHLPVAVLDRLVGHDALAVAERGRLTRTRTEGDLVVTLDHPLYGEVRRGALDPRRAATLRDRLLDAFEGLDTVPRADVPLLARWYVESGRIGPRAADLLTSAAEMAWAGNDPRTAARLARLASDVLPGDRNGRILVNALARLGEATELARATEDVIRHARSDEARAEAVLNRALFLFQFANQPDEAERFLLAARDHLTARRWRDLVLREAAIYRLQRGDLHGAEELAAPLATEGGDPVTVAAALAVLVPVRLLQGHVGEATALAEQGLSLALRHSAAVSDPLSVGEHVVRQIDAWIEAGRLRDAEVVVQGALAALDEEVDPFARAFVAFQAARVARQRGRLETAGRWFREAVAGFEAIRRRGFVAWAAAGLADTRAEVGDLDGARAAAERCRAQRDHPIGLAAGEVDRSLAWVEVAAGRLDAAAGAFAAAAQRSLDRGDLVHAAHALHDLVRIGRPERAAEPLAGLARRSDGAVLAAYADHARAAVDGSPEALAAAAARFAAMGCDLHAAEAWSRSAERAEATGHPRRAVAARRQAAVLAAGCEGASTPLLAAASPEAFDLSAREREIAELVASGMRRREIAEHLVVSPRTVDSHVQRIYRKLGVRDRAGLAAALAQRPAPPG